MRIRSISLSQLTSFAACAKQWQLKKLIREPYVQSVSQVFGSAVHAGLETFNNDHYTLKSKVIDRQAVIDEFKSEFDDNISDQAFKEEYEKVQRQKNSRKALKSLPYEEFVPFLTNECYSIGTALLNQWMDRDDHGEKAIIIEDRRVEDLHGLTFRFIIDLLDVYQGKVRLRDYKTKNKMDKKLARIQLTGYAWALRKYCEIDVDIIEQANFVRTASNPRVLILPYEMKDLEQDFAVFESEVETFIRGTMHDIFPRNREHYCDSCEVREVCFSPAKEAEILEAAAEAEDKKTVELINTNA
jgi:CRISPR/Cas system-associated exonuclease Cas4 (RecB family)